MIQQISVLNKCCSSDIFIHQRIKVSQNKNFLIRNGNCVTKSAY